MQSLTPSALAVLALLAGCGSGSAGPAKQTSAPAFDGAPLPAQPAPNFTLTDQNGHSVTLSSLRGRPLALSFLYTRCGATCEVIAQQLRGSLDEQRSPVAVLIISAEPRGDSPQRTRAFLARASLTGRALYLTGPPATLRRLWREYHVRVPSEGRQTFDSYAFVMLIDAAGRERDLFETEELTPEALTHDIGALGGG